MRLEGRPRQQPLIPSLQMERIRPFERHVEPAMDIRAEGEVGKRDVSHQ